MKQFNGTTIGALVLLASFTQTVPVPAKEVPKQVCPSSYSLIGEVCISDVDGDVVRPTVKK